MSQLLFFALKDKITFPNLFYFSSLPLITLLIIGFKSIHCSVSLIVNKTLCCCYTLTLFPKYFSHYRNTITVILFDFSSVLHSILSNCHVDKLHCICSTLSPIQVRYLCVCNTKKTTQVNRCCINNGYKPIQGKYHCICNDEKPMWDNCLCICRITNPTRIGAVLHLQCSLPVLKLEWISE